MSISLALFMFVLFFLLMQLVNGAQFLVIIFFLLFPAARAAAMFETVIVVLKVYMHHYNHKILTLRLKF